MGEGDIGLEARPLMRVFLVPMGRIELPTSPLPRECYTTELHGQVRAVLVGKTYIAPTCNQHNKKPNLYSWAKCLILLVPLAGIELATFALRMRCSTN